MILAGRALVLAGALSPIILAAGPVNIFFYSKIPDNHLLTKVFYDDGLPAVNLLTQMNSVETALALEGCSGPGCKDLSSNYSAFPVYPCNLTTQYKGQVVGYGKPFVQTLGSTNTNGVPFFDQVILAADYLNDHYPVNLFGGNKTYGVLGLGPLCAQSCLAKMFDTPDYSASILQNLFKLRLGDIQEFYFQREVDLFGSVIVQNSISTQDDFQGELDVLIPIVPGACTWTFKISSPIKVFKATTGGSSPFTAVQKPASITYDPTSDFSIVSQELAESYASAFNSLGNPYAAVAKSIGDLIVFQYWNGRNENLTAPKFPAIEFDAVNALGDEVLLSFAGVQGVYFGKPLSKDYLPFAYYKNAPCLRHWILGFPAINNGISALTTSYKYPKMVVEGTAEGITNYYIQLA